MSLKYTILGFLNNGPKTGYDLQKKIDMTISHFWPSTQSQVYRTLNDLAQNEFVVTEVHYQNEKPNKKVYTITEKGIAELQHWLTTPLPLSTHRSQLLIQLFFSKGLSRKSIISNLEHYDTEIRKREKFLNRDEIKSLIRLGENPLEYTLFEIILDNGLQALKSEREWVEKAIEKIKGSEGVSDE